MEEICRIFLKAFQRFRRHQRSAVIGAPFAVEVHWKRFPRNINPSFKTLTWWSVAGPWKAPWTQNRTRTSRLQTAWSRCES